MSLAIDDIKLPDGFEKVLKLVKPCRSQRLRLSILKNSKHNLTHQISLTDVGYHTTSNESEAANSLNNTVTNLRTS